MSVSMSRLVNINVSENPNSKLNSLLKEFYEDGVKYCIKPSCIYKKKLDINNNKIEIPHEGDFIYKIEIVADKIDDVVISIGGENIHKFYKVENVNGLWTIDFDNFFINYNCLPIHSVKYYQVVLKINGNLVRECYIEYGMFPDKETRRLPFNHGILFNHEFQYNFTMNNKKISLVSKFITDCISDSNIISELIFEFENDVDVNNIDIFAYNEHLTSLNRNDFIVKSRNKIIINKFYYKLFLFGEITIKFDKKIVGKVNLTTKNVGALVINNGRHSNLFSMYDVGRTIKIPIKLTEIDDNLYMEKVVPKNDETCAISQ